VDKKSRYIVIALIVAIVISNSLWYVSFSEMSSSYKMYKQKFEKSVKLLNSTSNTLLLYQKELNETAKILNVTGLLLKAYNKTLRLEILENSIAEFKSSNTSFYNAVNLTLRAIEANTTERAYYLTIAKNEINSSISTLAQLTNNGKALNLPKTYRGNISKALYLAGSVEQVINNLLTKNKPSLNDIATLDKAKTLFNYYITISEIIMLKNTKLS